MSLPSKSIQRPVAVAMLFVAIAFIGVLSLRRLPIDLLPDIAYPKLVIYTAYPDVGPAEVEQFVTRKIEAQFSRVPGVERIESVSREGVSLVILRFAWGTNMEFAVLNVREKLDNMPEIGNNVRPTVLRTDPTAEPVMTLSVAGRGDLRNLKDFAESVIRRRLEQLDGVAQASVTGGLEREIQIEIEPRLLESYGLTLGAVSQALDAANQSGVGGTIRRGRYRYSLRTIGEFRSVDEIGDVVVRKGLPNNNQQGNNAPPARSQYVTLRDVATIRDGFQDRESIARYCSASRADSAQAAREAARAKVVDTSQPARSTAAPLPTCSEAVGLLLFKEAGANTVNVSDTVRTVLEQLRREYPELTIDIAMDQAGFISNALQNVMQEVVVGGILAFLVLFLFLRDARYPVAIALAIPLSVIATFALLDATGISLNIMSLGGLALGVGLLMDNSIVVIENIFRHREQGLAPAAAAALGAEEVQAAIVTSTLTTIAVFGPIIYVEGIAGALFASLSLAVAFSLGVSVIVALSLLPVMAARWGSDHDIAEPTRTRRAMRAVGGAIRRPVVRATTPFLDSFDRGFHRFHEWYERLLASALRHRGRVVALGLAIFVVTVVVGLRLERSVLPEVDQGAFRAVITLPRGTPLEVTESTAEALESMIMQDKDVDAVFSRIGRQIAIAGMSEEETGLNTATLEARLLPKRKTADVLGRLTPQLARFPANTIALQTGQATALSRLLGGSEADLAVRVTGEDPDSTFLFAQEVEKRLTGVPSITNVQLGTKLGQPEVLVKIDREKAASFGIQPRVVQQAVDANLRGVRTTQQYVDFDQKITMIVRLPEERRELATLQEMLIQGVPLRELITIEETTGASEIRRVNQTRVVAVQADVVSGDLAAATRDMERALSSLPRPGDVRWEIGGENEEMRRSFRALIFAMVLAVLLVYMILAAEFESFVHPFTVLLSVPLGTFGAVLALWITGAGLNTVSLIGMVVLVGIVDNDAVVKVDFINQMRRKGMSVRDAIREAGHARLRPILINTITALLGLLPMALGIGPGAELQAPLAIAVFGGLITATALTLIVIPVVYDLLEEGRGRVREAMGWSRAPSSMPVPQAGD
jgi:hydrophobic/amphiphilic exporter-1 (mainly G- bacteria), HAE1 family